ncbi:hypothetical protein B0T19DRAFT_182744 [Cercophora scortea]|uniref:Uncharacterized protein n=1 Tax=Cercophora scortea TaxID=314031 RepID=A0AAE0IN57_9PEZI|nr:hypothetical protein B0T19DRAFT_182744 [Cercophora scortea]
MASSLQKLKDQYVSAGDKAIIESIGRALDSESLEGEQTAAEELDKNSPPVSSPQDVEDYLWRLWGIFISVARIVGQKSGRSGLTTLVGIVKALKAREKGTVSLWGRDTQLWKDLPLFGAIVRDTWNTDPAYEGAVPSPADTEEWRNLNSFAARLYGEGAVDWPIYGLWQLRSALENPLSPDEANIECSILAATEWILHSGKGLFILGEAESDEEPLDPANGQPTSPGPLYTGSDGFSRERWDFWKKQLQMIADSGILPRAEVKAAAEGAVKAMEEIEQGKSVSRDA